MRNNRHTFFLVICLILCMVLGSHCKRDKCKRVTCVNGTCVEGICNCNSGYFKEDCSAVINAGYDGTWKLTEECTAGTDEYNVVIAAVAENKTQLTISGIWEQSDSLLAEIAADGYTLSIARQALGSKEVSASGTINDLQDEITLVYQVFFQGGSQAFDICTATITKN